jgi:hypothetical protein
VIGHHRSTATSALDCHLDNPKSVVYFPLSTPNLVQEEADMHCIRKAFALSYLASLVAGCSVSSPQLADREAVTRCLPSGCTLHQFVEIDSQSRRIDLEMKLAQLGARPGSDGKLYDRNGRRIEIVPYSYAGEMGTQPAFWPSPTAEELEAQRKHVEEEAKRLEGATVIRMERDPSVPHPP